ncbi:hypothetical protein AK812_SmicGene1418 [Symbiodinium microadriaticum]|uniref:Uncharacterized protein n=1 Tax=Symbiodinium microadriaticum TaxID=2951 RepID=A0A1Q9F442_SYMMI|nr:hypothetical protein AK812_SmicGene1418 [Symbiodinium microadriaticum]
MLGPAKIEQPGGSVLRFFRLLGTSALVKKFTRKLSKKQRKANVEEPLIVDDDDDEDDPDRLQFHAEEFLDQEESQRRWNPALFATLARGTLAFSCALAFPSSLSMSDSQDLEEVARAALAAGQRRQAAAKLLLRKSAKAAPAASPCKAKDPPLATPMKEPAAGKRAREPRSSPANTVTPSTKTPDPKQIKTEDVAMTPKKTLFDEGIGKGLSTGSLESEIATPAVVRQAREVAGLNKGTSEAFLDTVPDDPEPDVLAICKELETQMTFTAKQIPDSGSKNSGPSTTDVPTAVVPNNDEAKQIPDSASKNSGPSLAPAAVVPKEAKQIPDSASKNSGSSSTTGAPTAVVPNDEAKQILDSASKNSGPESDAPALKVELQQASQLLEALKQVAPGATQASLLRPGTIDFAELIQQMQNLQASQHGGSGSSPDIALSQDDASKRSADDGEKVHSDAKSMPPPSSIPVKRPPQEVLPATRPNSPAPPSLAQRAEAEPAPEVQQDLEAAAKDIQASACANRHSTAVANEQDYELMCLLTVVRNECGNLHCGGSWVRPDCPPAITLELKRLTVNGKRNKKKLHELFDEFVMSGENWGASRVQAVYQWMEATSNQNVWRWMTRKALLRLYEDEKLVDALVEEKEQDPLSWKYHPDFPQKKVHRSHSSEMRLFKCWVDATETKEQMQKYQMDFIREGKASDNAFVPTDDDHQQGDDDTEPQGGNKKHNKNNKENPRTIKEKTTEQLAKAVVTCNTYLLEIKGGPELVDALCATMHTHGAVLKQYVEQMQAKKGGNSAGPKATGKSKAKAKARQQGVDAIDHVAADADGAKKDDVA